MTDDMDALHPDSKALHADRPLNRTRAVTAPIWQTSTFWAETDEEFLDMATRPRHDMFYTRYGNPTHSQVAAVVAALEGGEEALVTASGMGAMASAVFAHVRAGDHVVAQTSTYAGTRSLLNRFLPRFGVETTFVDQRDPLAFEEALRPTTRVVVVESPSNPLAHVTDLAAVSALASARGIVTIADNTFATPINQRPLEHGVDVVVHSATKYLGGHSDLIAGVVVGSKERVERMWEDSLEIGVSAGPFDAWLMLRGLRTLPIRMERHNRNASAVARFLEEHPAVEKVYYAGLASNEQHDVARRQMSGFGGVVSFDVAGGFERAEKFVAAARVARRAASLGGVETLLVHPAAMWAKQLSPEQQAKVGISTGLVRMSVGLEDERDLLNDLDRALA